MTIAALVSGGVDSSVVVPLLKEQGYDPHIFYIKIGMNDDSEEWDCPSEEDVEITTWIAKKYGCKFDIIDLQKEYFDRVGRYTMDTVAKGLTPNPDVMCNSLIKFGAFEEKAGYLFDRIATGHYARQWQDANGICWLGTANDPVKDQTDFLGRLSYQQLSKAMFPIGHLPKAEVRRIAEKMNLPSATRHDSQGICFLGKINYNDFIRRFMGEQEGKVIDIETGKVVGKHQGFWFHTIGQRKGLGMSGGPWFVVKKNVKKNIIFVAHGWDTQLQYGHDFRLADFHFITEPLPVQKDEEPMPIQFKVRHVDHFMPGTITLDDEGYHVHSDAPIQGIAPGQFGCIYDADATICYGSGEIGIFKMKREK